MDEFGGDGWNKILLKYIYSAMRGKKIQRKAHNSMGG